MVVLSDFLFAIRLNVNSLSFFRESLNPEPVETSRHNNRFYYRGKVKEHQKRLEVDVYVVKIIGMILLAVYLIAKGLEGFLGLHLAAVPEFIMSLIGIAAGVLILISIRNFYLGRR